MKRKEFTKTRLAICEGNEDAALVRELIARRKNIPEFDVSPINDLDEEAKGNGGFRKAFIASDVLTGFESVAEVVVVADNDDDPDDSFEMVRSQLQKAKDDGDLARDWAVPGQPGVRVAGDPSVTIWMWPALGENGCLETLLWKIAKTKHKDAADCVEQALKCSGANTWATSKQDKSRIRCLISLIYKKNPALALSLAWRDAPQLFLAQSAEFTPIATFLASL